MKRLLILLMLFISAVGYSQRISSLTKTDTLPDSSRFEVSKYMGKKVLTPLIDSFKTFSVDLKGLKSIMSTSTDVNEGLANVISFIPSLPVSPDSADRYIFNDTIREYNGTLWIKDTAQLNDIVYVNDSLRWYKWSGIDWETYDFGNVWAKNGNNIYNTNTDRVYIGSSTNISGSHKFQVKGGIYSDTYINASGLGIDGLARQIYSNNTGQGYFKFDGVGGLMLSSGNGAYYSTLPIKFLTNGAERMRVNAGGGVQIYDSLRVNSGSNSYRMATTRGTANQYLKTDGAGLTSWADVSSGGSSAQVNQIQVKRLAKADTIITSIDLIANNTLFPDADSVQFYLYGSFTATVNLANPYTKVYAGDAIITRTSANGGILLDRGSIASGYVRWYGGNITSYGQCYYTFYGSVVNDIFQPNIAKSTNADCIFYANQGTCIFGTYESKFISNFGNAFELTSSTSYIMNLTLNGNYQTTANDYAIKIYGNVSATINYNTNFNTIDNSTVNTYTVFIDGYNSNFIGGFNAYYLKGSTTANSKCIYGVGTNSSTCYNIKKMQGGIEQGQGTMIVNDWQNTSFRYAIPNIKNSYLTVTNVTTDSQGLIGTFENCLFYINSNGAWLKSYDNSDVKFNSCIFNYISTVTNYSYYDGYASTNTFNECKFYNTQISSGTNNGMFYSNRITNFIFNNCYFKNSVNSSTAHFIKNETNISTYYIDNCNFKHINTSANVINSNVVPITYLYNNSSTNCTTPINQTITNLVTNNGGHLDNNPVW